MSATYVASSVRIDSLHRVVAGAAHQVIGLVECFVHQSRNVLIGQRVVHPVSFPASRNETTEPQLRQVLADRRRLGLDRTRQVPNGALAAEQCMKDTQPRWVGQKFENRGRRLELVCRGSANLRSHAGY